MPIPEPGSNQEMERYSKAPADDAATGRITFPRLLQRGQIYSFREIVSG
jgi:hypothetical protein